MWWRISGRGWQRVRTRLPVRAILTWHSVDDSGSPISVSREEFRRQVA